MSKDKHKKIAYIGVPPETHRQAKYISVATGQYIGEVVADAIELLKMKYQLPAPPAVEKY